MDAELKAAVLKVAEKLPHWEQYKEARKNTELCRKRFDAAKEKIQPWHDDVDRDLRDVRGNWVEARRQERNCREWLGGEILELLIAANEMKDDEDGR